MASPFAAVIRPAKATPFPGHSAKSPDKSDPTGLPNRNRNGDGPTGGGSMVTASRPVEFLRDPEGY